ncbi:MAG: NADH-quinone oxidoreductase subunit [Abditibacteriota bacterium]|nr:NADH-quinone oxidoreductase subunit [Abditibacteriota bacterium]
MTLEQLMQSFNLPSIAPEAILSIAALVVMLAGAFLGEAAQRRALPILALAGTLATAVSVAGLWNRNLTFGAPATAVFVADNFALFFKWIFLFGLAVTIAISTRFLQARSGDRHTVLGEYYALLMLSTVGMMMVSGARDLLVVFLGIETLSIALYVLAGFARARLMSNEAALKYFLLGAFATGFLLYGIALTYYATGSTLLPVIKENVARGVTGDGSGIRSLPVLYGGVALLLIGLGFKAALVPFHQWTPDVYEGSPTPVTAFMAVGAKAAAFAAIMRVFPDTLSSPEVLSQWFNIVLVIAVLTMTIGNVVALSQDSLKRMLAYSSIAHAGYLLMGVLAAGNASRSGDTSAISNAHASVLMYLAAYALMNMGAFAVLVWLETTRRSVPQSTLPRAEDAGPEEVNTFDSEDANLRVEELRGLASRQPLAAAALTIFLFSLAGVPPTVGFFGKLFIFTEAFRQNLVGLVLVGVLNTVISAYYYLRPVIEMWAPGDSADMKTPDATAPIVRVNADGTALASPAPRGSAGALTTGLSPAVAVTVVLCAIAVFGTIVVQNTALDWARQAAPSSAATTALSNP